MGNDSLQHTRLQQFIQELLDKIQDPIHRTLVEAYEINNPVQSMESELNKILMGILNDEDKEYNR